MSSWAFGSLAKHGRRHPTTAVHASTSLRRACSMLQQNHQLHHWALQLHRWPKEKQLPEETIGGRPDQKLAALTSISDDAITLLKKKKPTPVCYAWFDPTPWMHITQGISMTINVNKLVKAGCKVKIVMADSFARTDPDIAREIAHGGGDPRQLLRTICSYNVETWRAAGMDLDGVEIVRMSDKIAHDRYWPVAMDVSRIFDVDGMQRWLRVHGSEDPRNGPNGYKDPYEMSDFRAADIFHPCLQCAAMLQFQKKADIWLLGLDQRVAHYMLVSLYRERFLDEDGPISLFHNMLPNLLKYPGHESFDPKWAIFMEDDEETIIRKMRNAFCPPESAHNNPCLEYVKHTVLPWFGKFEVLREEKEGGDKTFSSMEELTADYESGALQPADVKQALASATDMMLRPVRDHFTSNARGKGIAKAMERFYVIY